MNVTREYSVLWLCVDCYFTYHYGSSSDDPDYVPDREPMGESPDGVIHSGLMRDEHDDGCDPDDE